METDRRRLLLAGLVLPLFPAGTRAADDPTRLLPATPTCPGGPTPRQTEGPYYTPSPPEKRNFRADGRPGKPLVVLGFVLTRDCRPVSGARVDIWHADGSGAYDNAGFALRGYQLTDGQGRYLFETVWPGRYPGRTPHIHVKVQRPGGPVLTTQLYFAGDPQNARDGLYDRRLDLALSRDGETPVGRFDFVVN